jgi:putative transposase
MVTPAARREAVAQLRVAYEVSERRACSTLGADRTSVRYHSSRPDHAAVRARLRELAGFAAGSAIGGSTSCSRAKASS